MKMKMCHLKKCHLLAHVIVILKVVSKKVETMYTFPQNTENVILESTTETEINENEQKAKFSELEITTLKEDDGLFEKSPSVNLCVMNVQQKSDTDDVEEITKINETTFTSHLETLNSSCENIIEAIENSALSSNEEYLTELHIYESKDLVSNDSKSIYYSVISDLPEESIIKQERVVNNYE